MSKSKKSQTQSISKKVAIRQKYLTVSYPFPVVPKKITLTHAGKSVDVRYETAGADGVVKVVEETLSLSSPSDTLRMTLKFGSEE